MNNAVTKVVIPVAGLGTRMLPATKAIPKEMLPVVDKPMIQYIVEECVAAGMKDIIFVTHSSKSAIENHFDAHFELETSLFSKGKNLILQELHSILPKGTSIVQIRQGVAKGLGHAVLCAEPVVGDSPFAVVLPDVLIDDSTCDATEDNLATMIKNFKESNASQIMVEPVPEELVSSYGVVDIGKNGDGGRNKITAGQTSKMTEIVEKPPVREAPSNLAVVGRYVLSNKIWKLLKDTPKGAGGEIQLTDAIATLMLEDEVDAYHMVGKSHDCGSKLGYMKANVDYACRHPELGEEFKAYIKSL